jgi:hypothetical protein
MFEKRLTFSWQGWRYFCVCPLQVRRGVVRTGSVGAAHTWRSWCLCCRCYHCSRACPSSLSPRSLTVTHRPRTSKPRWPSFLAAECPWPVSLIAFSWQSHGRVAVAMLGVKVVLTLMFTLMDSVNVVILAIASLIGGFIWFSLHVYFVPFHNVCGRELFENQ